MQNKAVLKSALANTTLNNDMQGSLITNVQLQNAYGTRVSLGSQSGSINLNYVLGSYQTVATNGPISIAFTNWPGAGKWGSMRLEVSVLNLAHTLQLPAAVSLGVTGIEGYNPLTSTITFAQTGFYEFEFTSGDGGATYTIFDLNRPLTQYTNDVNIGLIPGGNVANVIANLTVTGNVTVLGNINGSVGASYGDSNVVTLLTTYGSNVISTTGNISGGNIIGNSLVISHGNIGGNNIVGTNIVAAAYLYGDASNVTGVTDATDAVNAVNVTGNSQPAITSVGTLLSLNVAGAAGANSITAGSANITGALNANSVDTTIVTSTGNVSGNIVNANVANVATTLNTQTTNTAGLTLGTEDIVNGDTLTFDHVASLVVATSPTDAVTLDDGTIPGQLKIVTFVRAGTPGTDKFTLTAASAPFTSIAFNVVGDSVTLLWSGPNQAPGLDAGWVIIGQHGVIVTP